MEQKLPSVRAIQMVRDTLHRADGGADPPLVVINRYDPRMLGFGAEDLAHHLGLASVPRTVANDFTNVSAAIHHGRPLRQQTPGSPALADIDELLRPLLNLRDRPKKEKPGTFTAAGSRFRLDANGENMTSRTVKLLHVEDDAMQQLLTAQQLATLPEYKFAITCATTKTWPSPSSSGPAMKWWCSIITWCAATA